MPIRVKNVAAGFVDEDGIFHPIRASYDYKPGRAGEKAKKARKTKAKGKKRNPHAIPKSWTTAKVRRNARGQVQLLIPRKVNAARKRVARKKPAKRKTARRR
jgi:hypothetical protein